MTQTVLKVTNPIVGFEYTETSKALTSLHLVMNTCSYDNHAAYELNLGNVPEPFMFQIGDMHEKEIKLPDRPEIFSLYEYGTDVL